MPTWRRQRGSCVYPSKATEVACVLTVFKIKRPLWFSGKVLKLKIDTQAKTVVRESMDLHTFLSWSLTPIIKKTKTREWEVPFCLLLTFSSTPLFCLTTVTFAVTLRSLHQPLGASWLPPVPPPYLHTPPPPFHSAADERCVLPLVLTGRNDLGLSATFFYTSQHLGRSRWHSCWLISADHSKDSVACLSCPVCLIVFQVFILSLGLQQPPCCPKSRDEVPL